MLQRFELLTMTVCSTGLDLEYICAMMGVEIFKVVVAVVVHVAGTNILIAKWPPWGA